MVLFTLSNGDQGMVSDEDADLVAHTPWFFVTNRYIVHQLYPSGTHGKRKIQILHRIIAERKVGHPLRKGDLVTYADENRCNCTRENLVIYRRKNGKAQQRKRKLARRTELASQGYLPCTQVAKLLGMTRTALLSQRELGRVSSTFFNRVHYMQPEVTKAELLAYCATRPRMSGRKPCKSLVDESTSSSS